MAKDAGNRFSKATKVQLKNGRLSIKDSLGASDNSDFYRFTFSNRSNLNCSLNRLPGNVELTLYNDKKKAIAVSSKNEGQTESISRKLAAGSYFLQVRRIRGESKYNLRSSVFELAGRDFSDALQVSSVNSNTKLRGNFVYSGSLTASRQERFAFYQFSLSDRTFCKGLVEGLAGNADFELFDSNRQRITILNLSSTTSEALEQELSAGAYFIKIKFKGVNTNYKLKLLFDDIDLGGNTIDNANPITFGANRFLATDKIGGTDTEDYYKVNLAAPSSLNLTLDGLSADANLQLINSSGGIIGASTNPNTTQDLLNTNLAAGTYFVRVFPATSGVSTNYNLSFNLTPLQLFGLTDTSNLVAFNAGAPSQAVSISVTGLATGEALRGIDFRPATGKLFGLSNANKLYTIDTATGAAIAVNPTPLSSALTGTAFGLDFNPTVDRVRVVSDADENLRLDPNTGTLAGTDTALAYAAGDLNAAANPNVTASAYTNNFSGSTTTTLFGIDTNLDVLVQQGSLSGTPVSPNAGTLFTVGGLGAGINFEPTAGFDIFTDANLASTAYATSGSALYSINLLTGAATNLGTVSVGTTAVNLIGFASRPLG
jgi:hypothetical protein